MKFRRITAFAAAAVAVAVVLSGCTAAGDDGGDSPAGGGQTLTLGSVFEPTSFDPNQAQEGHFMQYYQTVYDSLILRAPDGELQPMLAESWEYNADNTALTLKLRKDVTFSDGAAFDAKAAQANLDHFRTGTGPQGATLKAVSSVDVVDDYTITINLSAPEPALLIYLSNAAGMMGSPAALGTDEIKTAPVGSGPYRLDADATTTGSQYTYVKTPDYWAPELQKYDKIVIKPLVDTTARFNALMSGQVDAAQLEAGNAEQAEGAGLVPHVQQLDWQGFIIFDRAGEVVPALGDVRVRQAINMAIDKEAVLKSIQKGRGELTEQPFGPASSAFDAALDESYPYNPEKARKLIAEAGYPDGFDLPYPTASALDPALTAVIVEQMAAVGIRLQIVDVPMNSFFDEIRSGKYAITWMQLFQPSSWITINQLIAPDSVFNPLHSTDATVEKLITEVQFGDEATSAAKAKELNAYLVEQAWNAPWFRPDALYYADKKVDVEVQVEQIVPSIYNFKPAS